MVRNCFPLAFLLARSSISVPATIIVTHLREYMPLHINDVMNILVGLIDTPLARLNNACAYSNGLLVMVD